MSRVDRVPRWAWRLFRLPPQLIYRLGFGKIYGRMVLLLSTRGRRTGKLRTTPLQYERIDEDYYVAAARGMKTDWLRNIQSDPKVVVRVGEGQFHAMAEIIQDQEMIADFLVLRLAKHPRFVGTIMRMDGYPSNPDRDDLITYANNRVMVILHPVQS